MKKTLSLLLIGVFTAFTAFAEPSTLNGTAVDQASKPYTNYKVRLHLVKSNQFTQATPLAPNGTFSITNVPTGRFVVHLLDENSRVVCTEGPFDNTTSYVTIDCGRIPAAWWLVAASGAAGITAGVVATSPTSPSR